MSRYNPDPQVAEIERERRRKQDKLRYERRKHAAKIIALRNGGTAIAPVPDADSERMEAQNEGRLMPKRRPNFHE